VPGAEPSYPGEREATDWCNMGYAGGRCPRFVANGGPDAVRFAVTLDNGHEVRLWWSAEREHRPFEQGELWFRSGEFAPAPSGSLAAQAAAYLESYRRRHGKS
jgi:hypothetical protein